MIDQFEFPKSSVSSTQIFYANSAVTGQGYQIWQKPKGCSMVNIFMLGGGGGGSGGLSGTAGTGRGGGGGGGSSAFSYSLFWAVFLPDTVYIQVGSGGLGSSSGVAGGAGLISYITTSPIVSVPVKPNIIAYSGVAGASGGGIPTTTTGGSAGGAGSVVAGQPTGLWGPVSGASGQAASTGGAGTGAVGNPVSCWNTNLTTSGGGGGAGCTTTDFAGGYQQPTAALDVSNLMHFPSGVAGIIPGGLASGGNGVDGLKRITPFYNSGGAGGGSNNSGVGGRGGNGGYGSGGGGGGAGTTGGQGGNGGDGLVIISVW